MLNFFFNFRLAADLKEMYSICFLSAPLSIYTVPYQKIYFLLKKSHCKNTDLKQEPQILNYLYMTVGKKKFCTMRKAVWVVLKYKILLHHLFWALFKANLLTITKANHAERYLSTKPV